MTTVQEPLVGVSVNQDVDAAAIDAERVRSAERLRTLLPELRTLDGFPQGSDDDILSFSDPPHYTACPNPFLSTFIDRHGKAYDEATDTYHREPFAVDVSEGKNDPTYNAHPYHTKVPHKAIMRYILHYVDRTLVQALQCAFEGLERVIIDGEDLLATLASGGVPSTTADLKSRLAVFLEQRTIGMSPSRVRIILGGIRST